MLVSLNMSKTGSQFLGTPVQWEGWAWNAAQWEAQYWEPQAVLYVCGCQPGGPSISQVDSKSVLPLWKALVSTMTSVSFLAVPAPYPPWRTQGPSELGLIRDLHHSNGHALQEPREPRRRIERQLRPTKPQKRPPERNWGSSLTFPQL